MHETGSALHLLATSYVTEPTRLVLQERLASAHKASPQFFDDSSYALLQAICARLLPQTQPGRYVDIAAAIDRRLAGGVGKGWRYDRLPEDCHAFELGLAGMEGLAGNRYQLSFSSLGAAQQEDILNAIARGEVTSGIWATLPADLFFEELLAMAVEIYYAHPIVQDEIGYAGFADAKGWLHIGLDEREPWEPRDR